MDRKGIGSAAVAGIVIIAVIVAGAAVYFATKGGEETTARGPDLKVVDMEAPSVKAGETATINVEVINSGGQQGSKVFELMVAGESAGEENVTLGPGESTTITFSVTKDSPGSYSLEIDAESGSLSVGFEPIEMAVVTDIGGRGDLAFNDMAIRGARQAKDNGYVSDYTIIVSNKESDYLPNLRGAAREGYDLVVGVGYLLADAMKTVANEYPDTDYALVDAYPSFEEGDPGNQNTLGLFFDIEQASALVGSLGSMLAAEYDKPYTGTALGIEIPVLYDFEAGYKWGANWAISYMENNQPSALEGDDIDDTPKTERVLWTYTGTFSDTAAGYNAAMTQIEQGAVACYNVGGPIGLGIFRAVEEYHNNNDIPKGEPPFGIGVDANQDWIRPGYIIASALKRVDTGVMKSAKWVAEGTFRDKVQDLDGMWYGDLQSGAVDISSMDTLETFLEMGVSAGEITIDEKPNIMDNVQAMRDAQPDWIWEGVQDLKQRILDGEVTVPAAATTDAIENIRDIYG